MAVFIDLPRDRQDIIKLTDWLEINALMDSDNSSSIEDLSSRLSIEMSDERERLERIRSDVSSALLNRLQKVESAYPFEFNGKLLSVKKQKDHNSENWAYLFCLLLSYIGLERGSKTLRVWKTAETSALFEELCTFAAKNFLSCTAQKASSLHFGAPRAAWSKAERPFLKALEVLKAQLSEGSIKGNPTASRRKDAGLDLVAWRPFPDKRVGKLILLGQCAAGNDYKAKRRELQDFFQYYSLEVGVIFSIFIPHEVTDNDWYLFGSKEIGIAFDRSRIAYYAKEWDGLKFKKNYAAVLAGLKKYKSAL